MSSPAHPIAPVDVAPVDVAPAARATHMTGCAPLGLYLHIPFCERKCPYCDFNTYAGLQGYFDATVDALCGEMAAWRTALDGRVITSVFIGGGTPTVLAESQLTRLFATLIDTFSLAPDCEITCEANPGTVDRPKFQHLRSLGVNRLSLGVQSFQPDELAFLGRIHDVDDVERAVNAARSAGFDNINLDFIFGLPGQKVAAWDATLARALALAPEHLSLYSLIVEPSTPLHHWVETGRVAAPDDDMAADLYEHAIARLAEAGYIHYEVSNWARSATDGAAHVSAPDARRQRDVESETLSPYVCRHNLLYWRNQEYIGIGPGAHSHLRRIDHGLAAHAGSPQVSRRWSNYKPVPGYVRRIQAGKSAIQFEEELALEVSQGETMMMGLRLIHEGVPYAHFWAQHGRDLGAAFAHEHARLTRMGLLEATPTRVRVTPRGLLLANQVAEAFLAAS